MAASSRRELTRLGAALGAAGGPAAAFGQGFAATGDARAHVWVLATVVAAVLGAVTLPLFYARGEGEVGPEGEGPGAGFGALFGFAVGLVAGCFAAFPMGAVMGGVGGALGAAVGGALWRRLARAPFGIAATGFIAAGVGLLGPWLWTR